MSGLAVDTAYMPANPLSAVADLSNDVGLRFTRGEGLDDLLDQVLAGLGGAFVSAPVGARKSSESRSAVGVHGHMFAHEARPCSEAIG